MILEVIFLTFENIVLHYLYSYFSALAKQGVIHKLRSHEEVKALLNLKKKTFLILKSDKFIGHQQH